MAKTVLIFLLAIAVIQSIYFYPRLPDTVVSHFDSRGMPNGWMSKQMFIAIYMETMALMILIFYLVPRFPDQLRNIPNRDYWTAPERIKETMQYYKHLGRV